MGYKVIGYYLSRATLVKTVKDTIGMLPLCNPFSSRPSVQYRIATDWITGGWLRRISMLLNVQSEVSNICVCFPRQHNPAFKPYIASRNLDSFLGLLTSPTWCYAKQVKRAYL